MVKRVYSEGQVTEFRRILKTGDSFVITIPKQWLDLNKLQLRDELKCVISKNKITITNKKMEANGS